jgi:hypothetical protein
MMTMKMQPASGRASAFRVILAASTPIFKTRCQPCRIAVRAEIEKLIPSKEKRPHFGVICTSLGDHQCRIPSFSDELMRFTEHCQLKTDDSQRSCALLFPYAAGRCQITGLLEQMP